MRPPSRKLMYADFVIQIIMLAPLILVSLACLVEPDSILLALFIQFFLGIWQVLSSLYTNFLLRLKSRRLHLLLSILFFAGAAAVIYVGEVLQPRIRISEPLFAMGLIVPQLIALYYARQTYLDAMQLEETGKLGPVKEKMDDDILDSGMIGE